MKVKVTEYDIQYGKQCSCIKCPIAKAIQRVFPGKQVYVGGSVIQIGNSFYNVSEEMKKFMYIFDSCKLGKPFIFELELFSHLAL